MSDNFQNVVCYLWTFKNNRYSNKFSLFKFIKCSFKLFFQIPCMYILGDICTVRQYVRADKKNINSCWNGTTPLLTAIRVHNAEIVEVHGEQCVHAYSQIMTIYKWMEDRLSFFTYRVSHETWQLVNSLECLLP